jgi:EmrB/QacA subfamily drug resistance transporter
MVQLIIFRGIQGLGAGGLMSLAMSIVGDVIPPRQRGRYQGYFGALFAASSVIGPLVGGFLVDQASWRWVFYVNLPIGAIALVVINRVLKLDHHPRKAHIDLTGALLLVGGVSLILVGVQDAGQKARLTTTCLVFCGMGLLLVGAFVWWERQATEPILPLRLFRNDVFRVSSALSLITGSVMFGAIVFLPQYLQTVRGVSPTISGLRLLPLLAGMVITSIGSGQLISRRGRYKKFVVAGTAFTAIGTGLLTLIAVSTTIWVFSLILFVVGVGVGMFMQTLVLATQNSIQQSDMGVGTSAITFFRSLGGAIGSSGLGAILLAEERSHSAADTVKYGAKVGAQHAFTHGMDVAYLCALPVAVIAFALSFLLREVQLRNSVGASSPASETVLVSS